MKQLVSYNFITHVTNENGIWILTIEARIAGRIPVTVRFPLNSANPIVYEPIPPGRRTELLPADMRLAVHKATKFMEAFLSEPEDRGNQNSIP